MASVQLRCYQLHAAFEVEATDATAARRVLCRLLQDALESGVPLATARGALTGFGVETDATDAGAAEQFATADDLPAGGGDGDLRDRGEV